MRLKKTSTQLNTSTMLKIKSKYNKGQEVKTKDGIGIVADVVFNFNTGYSYYIAGKRYAEADIIE